MTLEPPKPSTSTTGAKGQPVDDEQVVLAIRHAGWWQGSVIENGGLEAAGALPPGATHWVLASQTCNLYNRNFQLVRLVEWVGAAALEPTQFKTELASGSNPRILHCRATTAAANGVEVLLACDIQLRYWMDRRLLARLEPVAAALRDVEAAKQKDAFIGWLARSYTRLELSDELAAALEQSTITTYLRNAIRRFNAQVLGIFLLVEDDDGTHPSHIKPSAQNKCRIEISFVAVDEGSAIEIDQALRDELKTKAKNPSWAEGSKAPKNIERSAIAAFHGLQVRARAVAPDAWTMADIRQTIRYSFSDHLSDSGSTG